MSSNPAVSIWAELKLKNKSALADDAKEAVKGAQAVFASTTFAHIPLSFDLPTDLAQKLQAKLATIKISPLNVPVNFVPGPMPGMPTPAGGAGGLPNGASSPNFAYYVAQLQQSILSTVPNSSPNWSMLMGGKNNPGSGSTPAQGQGGGGGNSNLYNPFSPRGLSRAIGSGVGVFGGLMAVHAATGMIDGFSEMMGSDRELQKMARVGETHSTFRDSTASALSFDSATTKGEQKIVDTINQVPLLGTLTSLIDQLGGFSRSLRDASEVNQRTTELHKRHLDEEDSQNQRQAALTRDPIKALDQRQQLESSADQSAVDIARHNMELAERLGGSLGRILATEAFDTAVADKQRSDLIRKQEYGHARAEELQRFAQSDETVSAFNNDRDAASASGDGNPLDALRFKKQSDLDKIRVKYNQKRLTSPQSDRARIDAEENAEKESIESQRRTEFARTNRGLDIGRSGIAAEIDERSLRMSGRTDEADRRAFQEKQSRRLTELKGTDSEAANSYQSGMGKEKEEFEKEILRKRIKASQEAGAEIEAIEAKTDETMMRARGQTYAADESALKRSTAVKVAALNREADATRDNTKAYMLRFEAQRVGVAGVAQLAAMAIASGRMAALDLKKSGEALGSAKMEFAGNRYGASQKTIADAYQQKVDAIRLKGGDGMKDDLASAANERDESTLKLKAQRIASNAQMAIEGQDAMARSHGQEGVGGVLSFQEELRKKYQDAGTDKDQIKRVDNYKLAEMAARRRELRPHDAGMRYGGAEYHDVLQSQINSGYGHGEAMKKLMEVGKMNAGNAGTPEQAQQKVTKELSDVVKQFGIQVDKMNKRKAV